MYGIAHINEVHRRESMIRANRSWKRCPDIAWEIIIVDNASTDNTSQVGLAEWEKHRNTAKFSLLHQPKPGLTFARELALSNAQYEFILFCDDDNWLNPNYINLAYQIMVRDENIGILGGHGEVIFEVPPPSWVAKLNLLPLASRHAHQAKSKAMQYTVQAV